MKIETLSQHFRKARVTSATDNGFPSRIPVLATKPSGTGNAAGQTTSSVFDLGEGGEEAQNGFLALFYGTGTDDQTFSARAIGWRKVHDPAVPGNMLTAVWIPVPLFEVLVTLGTQAGVAGGTIVAAELFADTIALTGTTANPNVSLDITSPANNTIAHLVCDFKGFKLLEFIFTTGGSVTDCNALFALL